jgi:hypothetical protein
MKDVERGEQDFAALRARIAEGDPQNRLYRKVREMFVEQLIVLCKEEGEWPVERDVLQITAEDWMAEAGIYRHGQRPEDS